MPLSQPAPRRRLHGRSILLDGYQREDGLFDIEGHLVDVKEDAFENNWRGRIEPGVPLHDMWLRLTLDEDYYVRAIEAVTDASPFQPCVLAVENFQRLVGLQIGAGWNREVRQRLGGVEGCTHLVEMLGPIGTVAFQTMVRIRGGRPIPGGDPARRIPSVIDSCFALRANGPVVAREWPEYYTGEDKA